MTDASRDAVPLSLLALAALALNGVVGVGIFFAPSAIEAEGGRGAVLPAFVLAFAAFAPSVFVFAALAQRVPHDGGPVAHARRAFGEHAAFVVGAVASLSALASTAAVLRGFAEGFAPDHARAGALVTLLAFGLVASRGLTVSAHGWSLLTGTKVAAFAWLLVAREPGTSSLEAAFSWPSASAVLVAAFCFQGFEVTSMLAGRGQAARAMVLAFVAAAVLYAGLLSRGTVAAGAAIGPLARISAGGIAFAMVAMTPRYLAATSPRLGLRGAWVLTEVGVGALVIADSLASLFALATLAVVGQYVSSALALAKLSPRVVDRAMACASLAVCALLATGASAREGTLFAVVVVAAAALSRSVTEATRSRHAP